MQPQLGFPKSRSSVNRHSAERGSPSSSNIAAKAQTASIGSNIAKRISAPWKSMVRSSPVSTSRKLIDGLSTEITTPVKDTSHGCCVHSIRIEGWSLSQRPAIFQKLSSDEIMFVIQIYNWGLIRAKKLAAKLRWKLRQPLPVLLEALCELDRNCTKRRRKPRPPLASAAFSKKRT